ncbi:hypothetical protein [Streptomyces sp. NPDC008317]
MEIGEYAFYEEARLDAVPIPRFALRIHATLAVRADGKTVYLEYGTDGP